jgi:hypothetical protein
MTTAAWHFRTKRPSDTARDPISSEFFANEAVKDAAQAVIREAIQNSLDARTRPPTEPAEVRIRLGLGSEALDAGQLAPFVRDVWPHLSAKSNGLEDPPVEGSRCQYLTIEDFGTSGLEGDPEAWTHNEKVTNSFYLFFRAEALSDKAGDERGRWGVGKLVFPRSSRGSTFFGYTVQRDTGRHLLMGRMILKHHKVGGVEYRPDAMYGVRRRTHGDDDFVVPVEDQAVLQQFRKAFGITRLDEPGLSVVVPWVEDPLIFAPEMLAKAVAAEYLLPILRDDLIVNVRSGATRLRIDRSELLRQSPTWSDDDLKLRLVLGRFAAGLRPGQVRRTAAADRTNSPKWPENALDDSTAEAVRDDLERGEPVAIDVPITVEKKDGTTTPSQLRVHMVRTGSPSNVSPVFVRDGITVTSAKGRSIPGYATLVTIDDGALATLLGDAENPAHTEWRPNTRGFKEKYKFGPAYLEFVRGAPFHVFRSIFDQDSEDDRFALGAFFPDMITEPGDTTRGGKPKTRAGGGKSAVPKLPPRPRRYTLQRIRGGFRLSTGDPIAEMPRILQVRVAYDVRRGNPLKAYQPFDFDLARADMSIDADGVKILHLTQNLLECEVISTPFRVDVTGFDEHRDLYTRVTVAEEHDER